MNDDDLEADIARMLAAHRARKTLGFSYYDTRGGYGKRYRTTTAERVSQRTRTAPAINIQADVTRAGRPGRTHQWSGRFIEADAEKLELMTRFAHAGLDVRGVA